MSGNINTVPHMLHHWATHQPDTAAFVFVDTTMRRRVLTRADVYRLAARYAAILRRHDIKRGDVVCNTLPNSPERVVSDYGIMFAGATTMNGQIFLADGEDFIKSLRDSKCMAVILDPLELKGAMSILTSLGIEDLGYSRIHIQKLPTLSKIFNCYWEEQGEVNSFMDMLEQQQESYVADVDADDLACIWTTSGSTGFSKLVPHTHSDHLRFGLRLSTANSIFPTVESFYSVIAGVPMTNWFKMIMSSLACSSLAENVSGTDADTEELKHLALSKSSEQKTSDHLQASSANGVTHYARHVFFNNARLGWGAGFPAAQLILGATRVLVDLSRGPPNDSVALTWTLVRKEQCQYAFFLPYYLQQLLSREDLWRNSPWKFKVLSLSGQPVHSQLIKNAIGKVTDSINVFYGSTEMGAMTCKTGCDPDKYQDGNNGKPLPGVEVKVADDQLKEISNCGKLGEIILRTDTQLRGYIKEEATQKTVLPEGWFRTGDVGYFNDEGDLFVICRSSFAIMRGSYLLQPGWLEARISKHPAVESVLVVPVPDPVLHQELCACVVTKPAAVLTAKELQEYCRTMFLTDSNDHMTAVPPYILFFSALPTTATGKTCRHTAAEEARARLGL